MHILVIPSWYPTNHTDISGCFFREQAQALARRDCRVGVIYPSLRSLKNPQNLIARYGEQSENDNGVITLRYHGLSLLPGIQRGYAAQWLLLGKLLFKNYVQLNGKPDIIHAHSMLYGGYLASRLASRSEIPYVITEHSSGYVRQLLSPFQLNVARISMQSASGLYAVSSVLSELLGKTFPNDKKKWEVVPNFVNRSFLTMPLTRKKIPDAKSTFKFCHVSLLNANKAVDSLVMAFGKISQTNKNVILSIGGEGPEKARLEELVRSLGLQNQIKFLGHLNRSEVLTEIAQSDAFVLTSRNETFGIVLIEAMALGKPVIATRCGGPESIVTEKDGFLVPVNNIEQLANAMEMLINNIHQYSSEDIRTRCSMRFSEQVIVDRLLNNYHSICDARIS